MVSHAKHLVWELITNPYHLSFFQELTVTGTDDLQWRSAASRLPQSQWFKQKIRQRLAGSNAFAANSEMRRKLIDFADQKLEKCKSPSGLELDRHCVGRATGQIMQLIGAVENNAQGGF